MCGYEIFTPLIVLENNLVFKYFIAVYRCFSLNQFEVGEIPIAMETEICNIFSHVACQF